MSEREYFSLRYTVPGFIFILVVFGLNYSVVLNVVGRQGSTDVLSISIAILSLFASSAIGFLISQVWFSIYHRRRIYASILRKEEMEDSMKKGFGWAKKPLENSKKRDETMATAVDYVLNNLKETHANLFRFFQRKIDLYHTMSSAVVSLCAGLGLGLFIRLGLLLCGKYPFGTLLDLSLFGFTLAAVSFFIFILMFLRDQIFFEYHPMLKLLLNSIKENEVLRNNFKHVFPDYFPDSKRIESSAQKEEVRKD